MGKYIVQAEKGDTKIKFTMKTTTAMALKTVVQKARTQAEEVLGEKGVKLAVTEEEAAAKPEDPNQGHLPLKEPKK